MWTVERAKSDLPDLLSRVDAGHPQVIDGERSFVVISLAEYERLTGRRDRPRLGRWLVENAPRVGGIDLPPRSKERPVPFDDGSDEEFEA